MTKKGQIIFLIGGVLVIFGLHFFFKPVVMPGADVTVDVGDLEKFSGRITGFKTDCAFDGECAVFVDGIEVVTTVGWYNGPAGASEITAFEKSELGRKVDVYAKRLESNKHTLIGDNNYYIRYSK